MYNRARRAAPALHIFVFFFSGPLHLLDLHSFPTRRSSDLTTSAPLGGQTGHRAVRRPRTCPPRTHGDRKSTRLNSSHRCISYAVFCLKKKQRTVGALRADKRFGVENRSLQSRAEASRSRRA